LRFADSGKRVGPALQLYAQLYARGKRIKA
jgi:hypothetical protein